MTNKAGTFAGEQLLARFSIHSGSISGLQSGENWKKSGQNYQTRAKNRQNINITDIVFNLLCRFVR